MDAATGLLYVGDGQYYDPSIGRFLTRNARPNQPNPYLPFDPTGAMLGPLGVLAVLLGRKKKKSKYDVLLFVLVFAVASGMTLTACNSNPTPGNFTATGTATPVAGGVIGTGTFIDSNGATATGTAFFPTGTPYATIIATCTLTSGSNIEYGGNEIMQLYQKMQDYPDGWWQKYPAQKGYKFTFEVFIGMMIIHEGAGNAIYQDLVVEATSQQLYVGGWKEPYCAIGQCSNNASANQWADQSESIQDLVKTYVRGNKHIKEYRSYHNDDTRQIREALDLGYRIFHPARLNYDRDNALSVYGNDPSWVVKINNAALLPENTMKRYADKKYDDGYPRSIYYFTGVNNGAAVYASVNQDRCWRENHNCDVIPNPEIVSFGDH